MLNRLRGATLIVLLAGVFPAGATGQTDYYNTDHGRPLRVEDARTVERHAFELQMAPLRLARQPGGAYEWEIEPSLAYGVLPRTHLEIGVPVRMEDGHDGGDGGLAGLELSAMHNLNVETTRLPALAIGVDLSLPVGSLAGDRALTSLRGLATRTFSFARFHANGEVTLGEHGEGDGGHASRWMAGIAVDRAFPLRSFLLLGDVFAEQPLDSDAPLEWTAEAGMRYQTSPQFNLDLGVGRRLTGADQAWFVTFGVAHAFALPALMGGR